MNLIKEIDYVLLNAGALCNDWTLEEKNIWEEAHNQVKKFKTDKVIEAIEMIMNKKEKEAPVEGELQTRAEYLIKALTS